MFEQREPSGSAFSPFLKFFSISTLYLRASLPWRASWLAQARFSRLQRQKTKALFSRHAVPRMLSQSLVLNLTVFCWFSVRVYDLIWVPHSLQQVWATNTITMWSKSAKLPKVSSYRNYHPFQYTFNLVSLAKIHRCEIYVTLITNRHKIKSTKLVSDFGLNLA